MAMSEAAPDVPVCGPAFVTERRQVPWIGTSWKMNKTRTEARQYTEALTRTLNATPVSAAVWLLPPFTALGAVCEAARGSSLRVGAQNMHWADDGPYTGEVSALMIKECGAQLVELGHFERRQAFGETDEVVNKKVCCALAHGLAPLICIGETAMQRDYSVAREVVAYQVKVALHGVDPARLPDITIAYEPGWAIGKDGTEAEPVAVNAMHRLIRDVISSKYGTTISEQVYIVYGGSVTQDNAMSFANQTEVDGLFVGRAALEVDSFAAIIKEFSQARSRSTSSSHRDHGDDVPRRAPQLIRPSPQT